MTSRRLHALLWLAVGAFIGSVYGTLMTTLLSAN